MQAFTCPRSLIVCLFTSLIPNSFDDEKRNFIQFNHSYFNYFDQIRHNRSQKGNFVTISYQKLSQISNVPMCELASSHFQLYKRRKHSVFSSSSKISYSVYGRLKNTFCHYAAITSTSHLLPPVISRTIVFIVPNYSARSLRNQILFCFSISCLTHIKLSHSFLRLIRLV